MRFLGEVGVGCPPTMSWLVAEGLLGEVGEALCPRCVFPFGYWGHSLCFWLVT